MDKVIALILAGGRGKRMDILCHQRPKPALPFAGGFRIIDFSLSNCIHSGIHDVALLVDYKRSQINNYLRYWNLNITANEIFDTLDPKNGSYRGTADAVFQNLDYIRKRRAEKVIVLAGDHVYNMDYRKMLAFHDQIGADVTVGAVRVPIEQAYRFGTISIDNDNRITRFTEKSDIPQSNLVSMGIYIFNTKTLTKYLTEDAGQQDSPHDFGYAVMPRIVKNNRVFAYKYNHYWQDIGTIEAYYSTNLELTRENPGFSLDGMKPVITAGYSSLLTKTSHQGKVRDSILGPGCVIRGQVINSILSAGVRVEEEAVVSNSVLMANTTIGYHSTVDGCVLDENVQVGKYCYIGFGRDLTSEDHDITVVGTRATIPDRIAIGNGSRIFPFVERSDFNSNIVRSGASVSPQPEPPTKEKIVI